MWGFLAALISGALMSVQGVFNTEVTKQTSLWVSTGWVQLSAFMVCVAAWLFTGRQSIGALWQIENKYTLLGGVIGAFITITVIQSMGALGSRNPCEGRQKNPSGRYGTVPDKDRHGYGKYPYGAGKADHVHDGKRCRHSRGYRGNLYHTD